jgi:hypothetical protein
MLLIIKLKFKSKIAEAGVAFSNKVLFASKWDLILRQKLVKCYILSLCMVLKIGHNGKRIRNTWEVMKCRVGEGWRKSVRPIM